MVAAFGAAAAYLLSRILFAAMAAGVGAVFLMRVALGG